MADIVDSASRSRIMAAIRSKDTQPEMAVRKALHARGYRYRLHSRNIPGHPDLAFARYRAVIFVHGCFWHGHDCPMFRMPGSKIEYWHAKIARNQARDLEVRNMLRAAGWRRLTIWDCSMKGKRRIGLAAVIDRAVVWLRGNRVEDEIRGNI